MPDLFEDERSVDSETGKSIVKVTANGVECENIVLTGPVAKRYVGLSIITQDLDDALRWIRKSHSYLPNEETKSEDTEIKHVYLDSTDNDDVKDMKAFFYASVITYGKCFNSANGRGISLRAKSHVGTEFNEIHSTIIHYRNNLVAHSGGAFDGGQAIVAPNPNGPEFRVTPCLWRMEYMDDRKHKYGFEELISHVMENVKADQETVLKRLLDNEAKQAVIKYRASNTQS